MKGNIMNRKIPMFIGVIGAIVVSFAITLLSKAHARDILVVLVGYFGGVYLGVGLLTASLKKAALQDGASAVFFVLALAGLWVNPLFLALACFVHAVWDIIIEHPKTLNTSVAFWYVPTCVAFDILLGVFILVWWR